MFDNLCVCDNCGEVMLCTREVVIELFEELQDNESVMIHYNKKNHVFDLDLGKKEMRFVGLQWEYDPNVRRLFLDEYVYDLAFHNMLRKYFTGNEFRLRTSLDLWIVLIWIHYGIFNFIDAKCEEFEGISDTISTIESITIQRGDRYEEEYLLWKKKKEKMSYEYFYKRGRVCPLCDGLVHIKDKGLFGKGWDVPVSKLALKNCNQFIDECKNITPKSEIINIEKEDILTYLKYFVSVENNILFFSDIYRQLFYEMYCAFLESKAGELVIEKELQKEDIEIKTRLKAIEAEIEENIKILNSNSALALKYNINFLGYLEYPQMPSVQKPMEPVLQKSGLFNKAKVEKQNAILLEKYNEDLCRYNDAMEKYNRELQAYNENEKAKIIFEEQAAELELKQQEVIKHLKIKKEELLLKLQKEERVIQLLCETLNYRYYEFYKEELEEVKGILRQMIECRAQLSSLGIIYPKYIEYVSLVTIYEYFQSGRCNELTGPSGAYNLYESELRQNIIIGKLDDIILRLDDIKKNQYLIYESLENVRKGVENISNNLASATRTLENIEKMTVAIKESSEMTAYFSAKTAEYTKRNAELTDALGYLLAFK